MFRAYGFRITMFALVGLLIGLMLTLVMPKKYEAVMQIMVDQRPKQSVAATSPAQQSVSDLLDSTAPRTVQTQVEQLTGYGVISEAAKRVAAAHGVDNPAKIPGMAMPGLMRAVTVDAAQDSDLIALHVRLPDPNLAKEMLGEMYNAFTEQNQRNSEMAGEQATAHLREQSNQVQAQLRAIEAQTTALQEKYDAPNIDIQVQAEIQGLRTAQEAMEQARAEQSASQARADAIRTQLQGIAPVIVTAATTGPNPNYQRLEADLAAARTELASARIQWEDDATAVKEIQARIDRLQSQMASTQKTMGSGQQRSPNPLYQNLRTELAQSTSLAAAAAQRYQQSSATAAEHQARLKVLPTIQGKMAALARQQEALTRLSQDYQQQLTAQEAARRARLTTATIISPAFAYPEPVSPNLTLNLSAGLIAGLLLGLLSAFNTESRRSPIRTLTQLNRLTLEPAFRTIPELPFVPLGLTRQPDEVFITLLGNFIRSTKRPYRIGVMGVDPDCGATVASAAIALGASQDGHTTLVVDTSRENGVARRLGLSEADRIVDASSALTLLRTRGEDGTQAQAIIQEVRQLEEDRSLTIIDLNPFKTSGNPVLYLTGLDECILLVRAGRTRTVDFLQAQQMLVDAGVPQVTVVLSRAKGIDDDFTFLPAADSNSQALVAR